MISCINSFGSSCLAIFFAWFRSEVPRDCLTRLDLYWISNMHLFLGKSGKRQIKITSQAQAVLDEVGELWNYSKNYICLKFKQNMERLEIPDARFHDLRRTFGYNLIKQGMPIYQVSKLLGHASVTTTEKHYAPLLVTDVEEFVL